MRNRQGKEIFSERKKMKSRLFIFTVSIMTIFGTYGASYANIPDVQYVTDMVSGKVPDVVDKDTNANKVMLVNNNGGIAPGVISEVTVNGAKTIPALSKDIQDRIYGAISNLNKITKDNSNDVIADNAILLRKMAGDPADKNKTLTLNEDGTVVPGWVSIPVGQTGTGGVANIWIEQ